MSGFLAFDFESPLEYTQKVINMDWSMEFELDDDEDNPFDSISNDGKDFVTNLIQSKSNKRLTADQALNHPWLQNVSKKCSLSTLKINF